MSRKITIIGAGSVGSTIAYNLSIGIVKNYVSIKGLCLTQGLIYLC